MGLGDFIGEALRNLPNSRNTVVLKGRSTKPGQRGGTGVRRKGSVCVFYFLCTCLLHTEGMHGTLSGTRFSQRPYNKG